MTGHVQASEDTHPKDYRLVFYGDIRCAGGHWTPEQCEEVRLAFVEFLNQQGARYVEDLRIIHIAPAGEPVAKTT